MSEVIASDIYGIRNSLFRGQPSVRGTWRDAYGVIAPGGRELTSRMLSFTGGLKVFVALEPCDLRNSFNELEGLVRERLVQDLRYLC